ncbi:hypothetical protein [Dictyobacter vulcani]|nr:hypothetical protein [Dictyobacter vulcani]
MTNEDNDTLSFQFGMKVKLNAAVKSANSDSVLDYYLDMIDPTNELHQSHLSTDNNALATQEDDYFKQRVLHIACLYMLIFNRFDEAESPIIDIYRQHVLPILQSGTDEEKRALFTRIKKQIAGSNKNRAALDDLCELVKEIIRQPKHLYGFQGDPYYVHIGLQAGLLTPNVNTMFKHYQFLSPECRENPKQILRYLTISGDRVEGTAFCKLPVEIAFTSVYFQSDSTQDTFQKFTLQYDIDAIDMVPTFFYPRSNKSANRVIQTRFHSMGIFLPYWSTFQDLQEVDKTLKHIKQFAYEWSLSSTLCMSFHLVRKSLPKFNRKTI